MNRLKYFEYINLKIRETIQHRPVICIGQNIDSGSFIGGLTRGLEVGPGGQIINATCAENTLVGLGFGIALNGGHCVLFMKQLDFLLLGLDQVVNTWNAIQNRKPEHKIKGSFTIIPVVIDSGFQGPQSSLNSLDAICSIGRTEGWCLNGRLDIDFCVGEMLRPGFRILALSHKMSNTELINEAGTLERDHGYVRYGSCDSPDVVIASAGFTLGDALKLCKILSSHGLSSVVVHIPSATGSSKCHGCEPEGEVMKHLSCADRLVILDDSKAEISVGDKLLSGVFSEGAYAESRVWFLRHEARRFAPEITLEVADDQTGWDLEKVAREIADGY